MPEHFAFYSARYEALPEENMRQLAGNAEFSVAEAEDGGRQFLYSWPNLHIVCSEMPAQQVPSHVQGLAGWLAQLYQGEPDERGQALIKRMGASRLVVGLAVEPLRDEQGLAEQLLGTLSHGLDALMLFGGALYDKNARLLLAPDGSFDPSAEIAASITERGATETAAPVQPTPAQNARYERVLAKLNERRFPAPSSALYVVDEQSATLQTPQEVARRALVLSAVTLLADDGPRADALRLIEERGLWPTVSPQERAFLEASASDPEQAQKLLWRLEGLWVLMWALGHVNEPDWPGAMCDVSRLIGLVQKSEADPRFIEQAQLRSKTEILDALQETLLLHKAISAAWMDRRLIPADLDWSGDAPLVSVPQCPAVGVVAERHHVLNWLTRFGEADWDHVGTST